MRAYIDFGLRYPNHYMLTFVMRIEDKEPKDEEAMGFKAFAYLPMLVEACVAEGKFRSVDVVAASQALWAAVHGLPAEELVKASDGVDMLVLGRRGTGGFGRLLLGSVTSQVAHHAQCAVLIVPGA